MLVGLKRPEALMLGYLIDHPGQVRQMEIVKAGVIYQPYITIAARGLKALGLIEEIFLKIPGQKGQPKAYIAKSSEEIRTKFEALIKQEYDEKIAAISSFVA
jgi:predicted transcriptional regulator